MDAKLPNHSPSAEREATFCGRLPVQENPKRSRSRNCPQIHPVTLSLRHTGTVARLWARKVSVERRTSLVSLVCLTSVRPCLAQSWLEQTSRPPLLFLRRLHTMESSSWAHNEEVLTLSSVFSLVRASRLLQGVSSLQRPSSAWVPTPLYFQKKPNKYLHREDRRVTPRVLQQDH